MKRFEVEHCTGQAGFEKTVILSIVNAESAAAALAAAGNPERWPVEVRDDDFAVARNPDTGERFCDVWSADRRCD